MNEPVIILDSPYLNSNNPTTEQQNEQKQVSVVLEMYKSQTFIKFYQSCHCIS